MIKRVLYIGKNFARTQIFQKMFNSFNFFLNRKNSSSLTDAYRKKAYSLPHHYKPPPNLYSWQTESDQGDSEQRQHYLLPSSLSPQQFRQRFFLMREWFNEFSDEQRNRVLVDLLVSCVTFLSLSRFLGNVYLTYIYSTPKGLGMSYFFLSQPP